MQSDHAEQAVTNLLTSLRHFCAARQIDFGGCDLDDFAPNFRLTSSMKLWGYDPFAYGEVIYTDGPCALAALQKRLGSKHMDHLLRTYALAHRFGFSTTHSFKLAAQHEAGRDDLTSFWRTWRIDG